MSIQILCEKFYQYSLYERNYSRRTIQRYRQVINFYCKYAEVSEIEEVTTENLRNLFYYGRSERKWTSNTFHNYHKSFRVFFKWCMKEGHLQTNPILEIQLPKIEQRVVKFVTEQQAEYILETVDNYPYEDKFLRYRNYAIFAIAIFAGLRKEEILRLKYTDVDIENLTLFIHGKGNKERIIPISYRLAETLKRYAEIRQKKYKTCPNFFTSYTRNVGFSDSGIRRMVSQFNKATGIHFGLHMLRHTFATLLMEGGCDIVAVSKLLGHSSIMVTMIYLHATVNHLRKEIMKHPLTK